MRILVLSSQAANTGSTMRAEYICKFLKKAGAQAEFIKPPLDSMPFMLDFLLTLFYYFFALLNRRCDLVIIVKPYPNTVWPALMLKARGAKVVIDIDDLDHGYRGGIISAFTGWLQDKLVPAADLLTSHNDELIKLIKKAHPQYASKIYKLNQCVDFTFFGKKAAPAAAVRAIRARFPGKKLLFYMANLNIASYLEDIFSALSIIKDPSALLLVAGAGPLFNHYKKLAASMDISDRVTFLGDVRRQDIAAYITASDLCLVYYADRPVNRCRASMKLREYLALNRPVVANSIGEIKSFSKYAYLSGPAVKAFAAEVARRIIKLDNRHKKGYHYIHKDYNWERETKKFLHFLDTHLLDKKL